MYKNNSSVIGSIGEAVAVSECIKHGIGVSIPFSDNVPYDLILDVSGKLYKMQVKTSQHVKSNGTIQFSINRTNGFTGEHTPYTRDEIDLMFLYCVENGFKTIIGPDMFEGKGAIIFRTSPPKNNQSSKVNMIEDYQITDNTEINLLSIIQQ